MNINIKIYGETFFIMKLFRPSINWKEKKRAINREKCQQIKSEFDSFVNWVLFFAFAAGFSYFEKKFRRIFYVIKAFDKHWIYAYWSDIRVYLDWEKEFLIKSDRQR